MKSVDYYKCDKCAAVWWHEWDTEDYNNDFTCCPNCGGFDFGDITLDQFVAEDPQKT